MWGKDNANPKSAKKNAKNTVFCCGKTILNSYKSNTVRNNTTDFDEISRAILALKIHLSDDNPFIFYN